MVLFFDIIDIVQFTAGAGIIGHIEHHILCFFRYLINFFILFSVLQNCLEAEFSLDIIPLKYFLVLEYSNSLHFSL